MHPFRAAIEAHDAQAAAAVLADGVVFRSPIVFRPNAGRSVAAAVVSAALRVFEDFPPSVRRTADGRGVE